MTHVCAQRHEESASLIKNEPALQSLIPLCFHYALSFSVFAQNSRHSLCGNQTTSVTDWRSGASPARSTPSARHPPAPAARRGARTRRSGAVPPPPRAPRGDGRFIDPVAKAQATKRSRQVGPQPTGGRCRGRASGVRETQAARQMTGQLQNIKELLHLGSNETNNPLENGQRSWHVSKENTRTATKDVKSALHPESANQDHETPPHTCQHHCHPTDRKQRTRARLRRKGGPRARLAGMGQPLWRTVRRVPKNQK